MSRLGMPELDHWVDHDGNLILPDGNESDDDIKVFDGWREPSSGVNPLWSAGARPRPSSAGAGLPASRRESVRLGSANHRVGPSGAQ